MNDCLLNDRDGPPAISTNRSVPLRGIADSTRRVSGPPAIQDAAVGGAYTAVRGLNDAPITGITGAAADAVGEGAATTGEGFAAGVGIAKFFGVDLGTFLYGYFRACHP